MQLTRISKWLFTIAVLGGLGWGAYWTRDTWQHWLQSHYPKEPALAADDTAAPADRVILSDQAIANLNIESQPLKPASYWKTISVPGLIVDRPGQGDRSIVAPVSGVVQSIGCVPGDAVAPGEVLLTLAILSEPLHQTQSELFKTVQDIKLAQANRARLTAAGGSIPEVRIIEADNQIARLEIAAKAYCQELMTRGFTAEQIAAVSEGKFVRELPITVPALRSAASAAAVAAASTGSMAPASPERVLEVQELKVELGQQVQPGQTLMILANHQVLSIEGHAFRDETPLLERAVRENWSIEVDFQEAPGSDWPTIARSFTIGLLGSTIDPVQRTFNFLIPLENQSRLVERGGHTQRLWRFRPGQKVRLHVPIEKLENVFVLPAESVTFDSAEAFTFTQNVNTFVRRPIHVLVRDRQFVVAANDGAIVPGSFAVQNSAAQLNRMVKSQSSTVPKGYHIHADGSVHKNEDHK